MHTNFENIYNHYFQDIYRLTYSYTLSASDTEDIIQNVWLKLYKHQNILALDDIEIKKWLIRVTINECKDYFRSLKLKNFTISDLNLLTKTDTSIIINLRVLPKKYFMPLYLYYYEGYKISEISKILNITESSTKQRLKRAKEKLKKEMEK